ncbi:PD-(D/E)XK motif protein [Flavobacteriaceae bacterium]|nr:PD-(D/E)XK motif protein [Flavobacteriaceae bacterium]
MLDLKSIWNNQSPSNDEIIVKTRIEIIPQFKCYAATNHKTSNHLFFIELSNKTVIPEFKKSNFRGVKVDVFDLDSEKQLNIYLIDNELKDIFTLFIENIIDEIKDIQIENDAIRTISNIIQRWKKLFDKLKGKGLSLEQQKGLLGELLFLNEMIEKGFNPNYLLDCWTGPDFEDKDFTIAGTAFEIKLTTSKLPRIKITSERQLDSQNLKRLYLKNYICENLKENGVSLNSLISTIRNKISNDSATLKYFKEKLELVGYYDEDFEEYLTEYGIKTKNLYEIKDSFPKIIKDILPTGVYDTSYYIENSAVEEFRVDFNEAIKLLKDE